MTTDIDLWKQCLDFDESNEESVYDTLSWATQLKLCFPVTVESLALANDLEDEDKNN